VNVVESIWPFPAVRELAKVSALQTALGGGVKTGGGGKTGGVDETGEEGTPLGLGATLPKVPGVVLGIPTPATPGGLAGVLVKSVSSGLGGTPGTVKPGVPGVAGTDEENPGVLMGEPGLVATGTVVGGSDELNCPLCSEKRFAATTRGQKRVLVAVLGLFPYKQTTVGRDDPSQKEKPHPKWVFFSLTN
jgi:hypothetical protein